MPATSRRRTSPAALLQNGQARRIIEAAQEQLPKRLSLDRLAANMVAWFSQRITAGQSDLVREFERINVDRKWAYRPAEWEKSPSGDYHRWRVVCITVVPPYDQADYKLDPVVETKAVRLVTGLGPSCRVTKFQWLVATDEPCGGIAQDLTHEGVENVFVFSALIGAGWKFWCMPHGKTDEWEFDGVAAFLQQQLG